MARADEKKVIKALKWRAMPPLERKPATIEKLAKELGLSKVTIHSYFNKADAKAKGSEGENRWENVIDKAYEHAFRDKSSARDKECYARLTGNWIEKREDTLKFEPTASDYIEIAKRTAESLREDYRQLGGDCPVCGKHTQVRIEAYLGAEPEHTEDREVAALGLPT